jgi:hypothetical protein
VRCDECPKFSPTLLYDTLKKPGYNCMKFKIVRKPHDLAATECYRTVKTPKPPKGLF